MATKPEWTEYSSRSVDVRELIEKLVAEVNTEQGTAYAPSTVYEDNGWGIYESPFLYKAVTQMIKEKAIWDSDTIEERLPEPAQTFNEPNVFTDEGEDIELETPDVITRALNWFKSAAPEREVRVWAKDEYEQRLLALYVEHVELTGETFYPELQSILENEYDFRGDN